MSDNVVLNAATGGSTAAADDIGGIFYQRVKPSWGVDGAAVDTSTTDPLPVGGDDLNEIAANMEYVAAALAIDDAAPSVDTRLFSAGFFFNDSTPDVVDEGDLGYARISANRNQYVTIRDGTGSERGLKITASGDVGVSAIVAALPAGANAIGKLAANSGVTIGAIEIAAAQTLATVTTVGTVSSVTAIANALPAGTNNIGDVDVLTVPTDPFGANADAATVSGSISAKLRQIATTGIPITGTVTVGSHAVTNAGTFATQATEADGANVTLGAKADAKRTATDTTAITIMQVLKQISASVQAPPSQAVTNAGTFLTQPQPSASNGLSTFRSLDLDEGALEVVKSSAGSIYGMWVTNTATGTRWVKFYDATTGTAGTGTPIITIGIPGNTSDDIAGNFGPGGMGIAFASGCCVGATTGVADNDTGAPGANDIIINVFYK